MNKLLFFVLGFSSFVYAADGIEYKHDVLLKNVYDDKNFDQGDDTGSWSQGLIYRGEFIKHFENFDLSVLPSFQYAQRLGGSHNLSDGVYAFDVESQSQPRQFHKEGLAIKVAHAEHSLQFGELWLNLPITGLDATKQLLPTYQGLVYSYVPSKQTELNLGYVNRYNPKDQEDFKKLTVGKYTSDGLYYVNIKHSFNDQLDAQFYNGYLLDLYNHAYLGLDYKTKLNTSLSNTLSLKYFNSSAIGDEKLGDIQVNYYGIMDDIKYDAFSLGLGYQKIDGNQDFPLLMGIPARYFIDWTQGMFNKKEEASYHVNLKYKLDQWIPGLDVNYRYIYGDGFKTGNIDNTETEQDIVLNYNFVQPKLKGLGIQMLYINYDTDIGKSYDEIRVTTRYQRKF